MIPAASYVGVTARMMVARDNPAGTAIVSSLGEAAWWMAEVARSSMPSLLLGVRSWLMCLLAA